MHIHIIFSSFSTIIDSGCRYKVSNPQRKSLASLYLDEYWYASVLFSMEIVIYFLFRIFLSLLLLAFLKRIRFFKSFVS